MCTELVRASVVDMNTSSSWFKVAVEVFNDFSPFSKTVLSDMFEDKVTTLELRVSLDSENFEARTLGIWNLLSGNKLSFSSSFSFSLLKQEPSTSSSWRHCISWGLMGSKIGMEEQEGFLTCAALLVVAASTGDLFSWGSNSSQLRSSYCLNPAGVSLPSSSLCSYSREDSTRVSEHSDISLLAR